MDERQPLSLWGLYEHRRCDQGSARQNGGRGMNPFTYTRAPNTQAAVRILTASPGAKLLGGGTNLVDLMKMGVERPQQLLDINRLPLAQVEELPNESGI